mmetsp:Transcript_27011/g.23903  ORF Transcript_27011/g.23903 Transcript_27011/m.23903 type:complete len:283 (-) Transcript_27011:3602-4450(-)
MVQALSDLASSINFFMLSQVSHLLFEFRSSLLHQAQEVAFLSKEVQGSIKLHNITLIKDDDSVILNDGNKSMGNSKDSSLLELILNHLLDEMVSVLINAGSGFIHQEDLGSSDHSTGHTKELSLTKREVATTISNKLLEFIGIFFRNVIANLDGGQLILGLSIFIFVLPVLFGFLLLSSSFLFLCLVVCFLIAFINLDLIPNLDLFKGVNDIFVFVFTEGINIFFNGTSEKDRVLRDNGDSLSEFVKSDLANLLTININLTQISVLLSFGEFQDSQHTEGKG